jgi:hypothetical protein
MTFNALDALRGAGIINGGTAQPAVDVLSELSEEEVALLLSLNARVKAATEPEIVAHTEDHGEDGPCLFWFSCDPYTPSKT